MSYYRSLIFRIIIFLILIFDFDRQLDDAEQVCVLGFRGLWANRGEVVGWRGEVPIDKYQINESKKFDTIVKRPEHVVSYIQSLAVRYLKPPTPEPPGCIIVEQRPPKVTYYVNIIDCIISGFLIIRLYNLYIKLM